MTKKEYLAFILGVLVFGTFFSTFIFYNLPDFWDPARIFSIPVSIVCALLTCPIVIYPYYKFNKNTNFSVFISLVILVGFALIKFDGGYSDPGMRVGGGLLLAIQSANDFRYLNFVLLPGILSVFAHAICGLFVLSLIRVGTKPHNNGLKYNGTHLFLLTFGVALLLLFTITCSIFIKSGPIYLTASLEYSASEIEKKLYIDKLNKEFSVESWSVQSVDTFVANAETKNRNIKSVLSSIFLFEIIPEGYRKRGKFRRSLVERFKKREMTFIGLRVYENPKPPIVPIMPSYRFLTIENVGSDIINTMEIKRSEFPAVTWKSLKEKSVELSTGFLIFLDESKMSAYGLDPSKAEIKIHDYFDSNPENHNASSLKDILIHHYDSGEKVFLKDIAVIEYGHTNVPRYEIKLWK